MGQRRAPRAEATLDVRIWGVDSAGKPFSSTVKTVDVSRTGARLADVKHFRDTGNVIGVQCGTLKGKFRVVWVARPESERAGQISIDSVERSGNIWGQALPRDDKDSFEGARIRNSQSPILGGQAAAAAAMKQLPRSRQSSVVSPQDQATAGASFTGETSATS